MNATHSQVLSTLLVYTLLPCNIIKTFASNFKQQYVIENYRIITSSMIMVLSLSILMHFVAKLFSKDTYERKVYEYSLVSPNCGYMGYALVESLLSSAGLMNAMLFAIPLNFYVNLVGFPILTKRPMTFKKMINVVTVPMVLGMVIGLSNIPLSEVVVSFLDKSSACMAPVSMLLAGVVVSEFSIRSILQKKLFM